MGFESYLEFAQSYFLFRKHIDQITQKIRVNAERCQLYKKTDLTSTASPGSYFKVLAHFKPPDAFIGDQSD